MALERHSGVGIFAPSILRPGGPYRLGKRNGSARSGHKSARRTHARRTGLSERAIRSGHHRPGRNPGRPRKILEDTFRKALTAPAFVSLMHNLDMAIVDRSGSGAKTIVEDEIAKAKKFMVK